MRTRLFGLSLVLLTLSFSPVGAISPEDAPPPLPPGGGRQQSEAPVDVGAEESTSGESSVADKLSQLVDTLREVLAGNVGG